MEDEVDITINDLTFIICDQWHETDDECLWFKLKRYFENGKFKDEIKPILKELKNKININGINLLKA